MRCRGNHAPPRPGIALQHGFSLLELLVVVAVLALLLGLGVPALNSIRTAGEFTKNVQSLADTLTLARSHALAKGRNVDVLMTTTVNGTLLAVGERNGTNFDPISRTQLLKGARIENFPAPVFSNRSDDRGTTYAHSVRFNSRGEARAHETRVDRKITIELLPNIGGTTPAALQANNAAIRIHGLSGGIELQRDATSLTP